MEAEAATVTDEEDELDDEATGAVDEVDDADVESDAVANVTWKGFPLTT